MDKKRIKKFQKTIWDFYNKHKRTFPWRETSNPYHILVSEIMLQQTQADRVVPYYKTFIRTFPNIASLEKAKFHDVYKIWQGLGYNRRALALKKLAKDVTEKYEGKLPADLEVLPGIGPYTAKAISIFSFNAPLACVDTNIRRVFIYHFFEDKKNITDEQILKVASLVLDKKNPREWHWALMDYGSQLRSTLSFSKGGNPNRRHKNYTIQPKFEGSLRQMRGAILRNLAKGKMNLEDLVTVIKKPKKKVNSVLLTLVSEAFVRYDDKKKTYCLT